MDGHFGIFLIMSIITRIILCIGAVLFNFVSVIIECRLPDENKSVKWNFDTRGVFYSVSTLINFISAMIMLFYIKLNENLSNSKWYFPIVILLSGITFLSVYIPDKLNIKRRFAPYKNKNIEEFLIYKNSSVWWSTSWNTLYYSIFRMATTMMFILSVL